MQRFYGIDLRDLGGALSWRRFAALVRHLPGTAATVRQVGGPTHEWTPTEYLLASVVDLLGWRLYQAAGGRGRRPTPIPRPGKAPTKRHGRGRYTPAQLKQRLGDRKNRALTARSETIT